MTGPRVARFQAIHWGLVLLAALGSWWLEGPGPLSVLGGGAVAGLLTALNAVSFGAVVRGRRAGLAVLLQVFKGTILLGLGWLAFAARPEYRPDPVGFAVGVTCLPLAALAEAGRARRR